MLALASALESSSAKDGGPGASSRAGSQPTPSATSAGRKPLASNSLSVPSTQSYPPHLTSLSMATTPASWKGGGQADIATEKLMRFSNVYTTSSTTPTLTCLASKQFTFEVATTLPT